MKKFLSMLLILTMVVGLSACGTKEATNTVMTEKTEVKLEAATDKSEEKAEVKEKKNENAKEEAPEFENLYPDFIIDETETTVTYIDQFENETTITKNPDKTVIVFNSILGLWYYVGGESLTKAKGSTNVPEEAKDLVDLGSAYGVSLEAIVALEPSLVVMPSNVSAQVEMAPILKEMGIETMLVDTSNNAFERFKENAYLFSKINETEDQYNNKILSILEEINEILIKAESAENTPKVAPILATSKSMSLESDLALVGEMVHLLGGENIYSKEDIKAEGETRIPFSIEAVVTQNPDIILISTMGKVESAKATVDAMIAENPAWNEVNAVKNDKVFYLPKDISVYKPNERYGEAFAYIAGLLYPELFPSTEGE